MTREGGLQRSARAIAAALAAGTLSRLDPPGRPHFFWSYSCSDLAGERPATIGIGAKVVGHARYVAFQMAEVAISGSGPVSSPR